jgi:superfamily II DNA or RNA helicase
VILRPYQDEAVDAVGAALEDHDSTMVVAATGVGKTIILGEAVNRRLPLGRAMIVSHRAEIIMQTESAMERHARVGVEMAHSKAKHEPIVVASVQSLNAGAGLRRMERFHPNDFASLVIDEAHRGVSPTMLRAVNYFRTGNPFLKVISATATPDRLDRKSLSAIAETVAFDYPIKRAIDDAWLVPLRQSCINVRSINFESVGRRAGDLDLGELARVMEYEKNLHAVARPTVEMTGEGKTVVFCVRVEHAIRLAEIINRYKPDSARFIHGRMKWQDRVDTLKAYTAGEFQYLVNVGVLTEGWDDPTVVCIVVARPTESRALYTQIVGRGLRPLPRILDPFRLSTRARRMALSASGKPYCHVIDFTDNSGRHNLMTSLHLLGGKDIRTEVVENARRAIESSSSGPVDPEQALQEAAERQDRIDEARERDEQLREDRHRIMAEIEYGIENPDPFKMLRIKPRQPNKFTNNSPLAEGHLSFLKRAGVNYDPLPNAARRQILFKLFERRKKGLCTLPQARAVLRRYPSTDVRKLTFHEASAMLDLA